ncbi:hypothetical protein GLOIN_2v1693846 [Rhizophagus irregularis DAOM 181602=DAOM 197198]|nr:hypothetical protein GLOIN_2v1693846 [Rhizophagus irregularis DAOM 181602=DAOM 197198]
MKGDKGESLKKCKFLNANEKICGILYINDGSTENAINYLLTDHKISKNDWIIDNLQPLYVIQNPSFHRLISELDSAFIIPDKKGIKKVIGNAYNYTLLALIKKIKLKTKNVSLTTDM